MQKCIIFDLQFGASGDMLLGSMIDLGLDFNLLRNELSKINLTGWSISPEKIIRNNLSGTIANVTCTNDCQSRNLQSITQLIRESKLSKAVIDDILKIFNRLAIAEATVHGKNIEEVHFHEIGAIDSIIDISAFCLSINILEIKKIYFNEIYLGSGIINTAHGEIPIPAPAVIELVKGYKTKLTYRSGEIITPTALAIFTTLGKQLIEPVSFEILNSGTGFGTRKYTFPSYTRAFLVNCDDDIFEEIVQIECNIDDMNPQIYPYLIGILFDKGALDVYLSEIIMKKGRPGILLTIIAEIDKIEIIKTVIYRETSTIGLRTFIVKRDKLRRDFKKIFLYDQEIRIKIAYFNDTIVNIQPEFDDCMKIAVREERPVQEILDQAKNIYLSGKIID